MRKRYSVDKSLSHPWLQVTHTATGSVEGFQLSNTFLHLGTKRDLPPRPQMKHQLLSLSLTVSMWLSRRTTGPGSTSGSSRPSEASATSPTTVTTPAGRSTPTRAGCTTPSTSSCRPTWTTWRRTPSGGKRTDTSYDEAADPPPQWMLRRPWQLSPWRQLSAWQHGTRWLMRTRWSGTRG